MSHPTEPVRLEPGQRLTLEDIQRLLPASTRIDRGSLVVLRSIRFRRAPIPLPPAPAPITPFRG